VKEKGIEGTVKIVIDIDETGKVVAARIKKSLDPDADQACIESWKKAVFQPAQQDGSPIGVRNFPRRCRFKSMD
jgi:TonB family protein